MDFFSQNVTFALLALNLTRALTRSQISPSIPRSRVIYNLYQSYARHLSLGARLHTFTAIFLVPALKEAALTSLPFFHSQSGS